MIDPVPPDAVALCEVSALLGWPEENARTLTMEGPFRPEPDGLLKLRNAFGLYLFAQLGTCELMAHSLAIRVAVEIASSAITEGDKSLVVAWRNGRACTAWFECDALPQIDPEEEIGSPLRRPMVVIPADRMFADFSKTLGLIRERARLGAH